ncbi:diaminopimelate epimerase [Roseospira visakhapatnamensis]|uniref:Diaminopimelate epimerase n=1 Tax=Roseospira visakhapatnamensis TaxID=390880 RepID=A0A7W6RAW9_9PROT|nr:diaminopimelate epimerase [Roseospira visakhapatnamensis]MBB4265180.1 diaminopimelate epimerase [Roseospira visakhapatnamensis]
MHRDPIPFRKMHGLGNDFVIVDARTRPLELTDAGARRIADRRAGVGCDQIITIEPPRAGGVAFLGIRNADGGVVEACGNATRCVAHLLMTEARADRVDLDTLAGPVVAERAAGGLVRVNMGPAGDAWQAIPLAEPRDTLSLDLGQAPFADAVAVTLGNPHVVAFVDDAEAVDLGRIGPIIEHHPLFPNRVNAEVVSRTADGALRMRVWERGAGITRACGTGACAAMVAAVRKSLIPGRPTRVILDGGPLDIDWPGGDAPVWMTGPVASVFTGLLDPSLLS